MSDDAHFLRRAIALSLDGVRGGKGGPFGAVIVRGGEEVGRGQNSVTSTNDPTAHAEVNAIRDACKRLSTFRLDECVLYASCEPCPMCLAAIYWARLPRVVYACTREDAAAVGFDDAHIYSEVARPIHERSLEFSTMLRNEAWTAMQEWISFEGRVDY